MRVLLMKLRAIGQGRDNANRKSALGMLSMPYGWGRLRRSCAACQRKAGDRSYNLKMPKFAHNKTSTSNGQGGAVYLNDAAASIMYAEFMGNRADEGNALYATNDSNVGFYNSFMFYNGNQGLQNYSDKFLFAIHDSVIQMHNITSSINQVTTATIGGTNADYFIFNSIMYESITGQTANLINSVGQFYCVVLENVFGVQNLSNGLVGQDPMFQNQQYGDFHLKANSPAIDLCAYDLSQMPSHLASRVADEQFLEASIDFDGEQRIWDDPEVNNVLGPIDAGADESYAGDVIFKSDFVALF